MFTETVITAGNYVVHHLKRKNGQWTAHARMSYTLWHVNGEFTADTLEGVLDGLAARMDELIAERLKEP